MKMEDLNIPLIIGAVIVGGLIGLYFYGKSLKKKEKSQSGNSNNGVIKVSGNDLEDLAENMKDMGFKNKVNFEFKTVFTYEDLATWINDADLKDAAEEADIYGCLLVRTASEIKKFNIDIESLSEEQKNKVYGALIVDTRNNKLLYQRWIIADSIDEDLSVAFGDDNLIVLK